MKRWRTWNTILSHFQRKVKNFQPKCRSDGVSRSNPSIATLLEHKNMRIQSQSSKKCNTQHGIRDCRLANRINSSCVDKGCLEVTKTLNQETCRGTRTERVASRWSMKQRKPPSPVRLSCFSFCFYKYCFIHESDKIILKKTF